MAMKGELLRRTRAFATDIIGFVRLLPNDPAGWTIGRQLLRSGTSIGANYREAQQARTHTEFLSKIQISLQEAEETRYWLVIVSDAELVPIKHVQPLLHEVGQIIAMLIAAVRTGKRNQRRRT